MTPEKRDELARRITASKKWEWKEGMNVVWPGGRRRIVRGDVFDPRDAWPDFTDAATVGVVLNQAVFLLRAFGQKPKLDFSLQYVEDPAVNCLSAAFMAARQFGLVSEHVLTALFLFFSEMEDR